MRNIHMKGVVLVVAFLALAFFIHASSAQEVRSDSLKRAYEMINQERYSDAIKHLNAVINQQEDLYEAWYLLGRSYYHLDNFSSSEDSLKRSIKLNKDFTPSLMLLANIYIYQKRFGEAEKIILSAVALKKNDPLIHFKLAEVYEAQNNLKSAESEYMKSFSLDPELKEGVFRVLNSYMKEGRYEDAEYLAAQAVSMNNFPDQESPFNSIRKDAQFNRLVRDAENQFAQKRYKKSCQLYEEALKVKPDETDVTVQIANCYAFLGDYAQAGKLLDQTIKDGRENPDAIRIRAKLLYQDGENKQAYPLILRAIELQEQDARNYYLAGLIAEELGRNDEALKHYRRAVLINGEDGSARFRYAYLLAQNLRYKESIAELEQALELTEDPAVVRLLDQVKAYFHLEEGNRLFDAREWAAAIQQYDRSMGYNFQESTLINKANALVMMGEIKEGSSILEKMLKNKKSSPSISVFESLAQAYRLEGQNGRADRVMKDLDERSKQDPLIYISTGDFYSRNGEYAKAVEAYRKALNNPPEDPGKEAVTVLLTDTLYRAGVQAYNNGDFEESEAQFRNILVLDPESEDARSALERVQLRKDMNRIMGMVKEGNAFYEKGKYAQASEHYIKVLDIREDLSIVQFNLANCYFHLENYFQAELLLRTYLEQKSSDAEAVELLARIYSKQDAHAQAREVLLAAIQRGVVTSGIYNHLGVLAEKGSQIKEAVEYYRIAIDLNPRDQDALINLGNLYYSQKEYSKSQEQYERVLKIDPENDIATYNLGFIYYKKNRLNDALREFRKAESMIDDYSPLYFNLARVLYYLGDYKKSLEYGEKAERLRGNDVLYQWGLANIYTRLFSQETDKRKKEDYREKALEFCRACIYNDEYPDISAQARGKITEAIPENKFLYMIQYTMDRKFTPQIVENVVYYFSDQENVFIKSYKETGEEIWRFDAGAKPSAQYRVGESVYLPLTSGDIIVLDSSTGQEKTKFSFEADELIPAGGGVVCKNVKKNSLVFYRGERKEWSLPLQGRDPSLCSVLTVGLTVVMYEPGSIAAYDLEKGKELWSHSFSDNEAVFEVNGERNILFAEGIMGKKNVLLTYNLRTGDLLWETTLEDKLKTRPILFDDNVICLLANNRFLFINEKGEVIWKNRIPEEIHNAMIQNELLFLATSDFRIYGYKVTSGDQVWEYTLPPEDLQREQYYTIYYSD